MESGLERRKKLQFYTSVVVRWSWLVFLCALIGGVSAYVITKKQHPVYRASTLLIVAQRSGNGNGSLYTDLLASNQLVQTYLSLVKTPQVMNAAAASVPGMTGIRLANNVHVSNPGVGTQILEIQVDDTNPAQGAFLANAVAKDFVAIEQHVTGDNSVHVFQPATPPTQPDHPSPKMYAIVGAFGGLMLGSAVVWFLLFLDDRLRTAEDVERVAGLFALGTVKALGKKGALLTSRDSAGLIENFRTVRTNLEFVSLDQPLSTIVITSALPSEGKTTVAVNLAIALALVDKRVLLIDADLRRPSVHKRLGIENKLGLTLQLLGGRNAGDCPTAIDAQPVPAFPNLFVLPAGPIPPNPTEMLASSRMDRLLESVISSDVPGEAFDVVIIDTPPAGAFTDAVLLAAKSSGTVLVADVSQARASRLSKACEALRRVDARVLGVVLNKIASKDEESYYSYKYQRDDEPVSLVSVLPDEDATGNGAAERAGVSASGSRPQAG